MHTNNDNKNKWITFICNTAVKKVNLFFSDHTNIQTLGLVLSSVVAAFIAVSYTKLFRFCEDLFHAALSHNQYLVFVLSPVLFLLAWFVVWKFAPEAGGSGIPQIMAANEIEYKGNNCRTVDRLLSVRVVVVKILSSLLCVMGGGAIGREGPTLQISASTFHFFGLRTRKLAPSISEHTVVVAGAAAGLASAFNTPLGGIVYAIEELGLVHFQKVRTALISGVIVSGLVAQSILGSYLYLGYPRLTSAGFSFLPAAILIGVLTGLLGAVFGKILFAIVLKRAALKKVSSLVIVAAICGLIMAGLSYLDHRTSGAGIALIDAFLFKDEVADIKTVLIRIFGTVFSYASGVAGGIFSPSLAIGATIGSFVSKFVWTDHSNLMVLLGMIGFLTGVTRTPFTAFILVLEMTDRHSAIFPMMLTALIAHGVSRLVDVKSFYENVKDQYLPKIYNDNVK